MANNFKERANFIWGIADLLRGDQRVPPAPRHSGHNEW